MGEVKGWLACLSFPSEMHVDVDWLMFCSNGEVSSKQNIYKCDIRTSWRVDKEVLKISVQSGV